MAAIEPLSRSRGSRIAKRALDILGSALGLVVLLPLLLALALAVKLTPRRPILFVLISEGVPAERVFSAHHAVDNAAYDVVVPEADRRALRDRLGAGERKIVLYLGRIEAGKGL
ncbi:MAG TPA: hypothetical protein VGD80_13070, partial [Kofleriaceae bacterium]